MDTPRSPEFTRDLYFHGALLLFLAAFAAFVVWPGVTCCGPEWRETAARSMLSQLSQAVQAYELDHAAYPPGDGEGSAGLVLALRAPRKPVCGYFEFSVEQLRDGDVTSPIDPSKIFHYRSPGVHHPKGFDLWCEDAAGRADGINNWEQ